MSNTLSPEMVEVVKSTLPFLRENGLKLTEHFYRRMFVGNPEVRAFFNQANQENSSQQRALAAAICAFAEHLETPEALASAVSLIANKHASLGVAPEHYPIVGEHLLGAINDLLAPAPKPVLDAWAQAYGALVSILTAKEGEIYAAQEATPGGWKGFRQMEVIERKRESQCITSFHLRPQDGGRLPRFAPGQYLTVRVPTLEHDSDDPNVARTTMRNYSLSGSPDWDHYRISVKREAPGHADTPEGYVSNYLHSGVGVGDALEIGPPCGDFVLEEHESRTPILLLSGGVGLTPMLSMLHSIQSNPVTFLHGAIDGRNHALREEVLKLAAEKYNARVHFRYSVPTAEDERDQHHHSSGLFTSEFLSQFLSKDTAVYFCGPKPMMRHVHQTLQALKHPPELTRFEFFGPQQELEA